MQNTNMIFRKNNSSFNAHGGDQFNIAIADYEKTGQASYFLMTGSFFQLQVH
jgi:hypothetical protein